MPELTTSVSKLIALDCSLSADLTTQSVFPKLLND